MFSADDPWRQYTVTVFNDVDFTQITGHEAVDGAFKGISKSFDVIAKPVWGKDGEGNEYATGSFIMDVPADKDSGAFNIYLTLRFLAVPRLSKVYQMSEGQKAGPGNEDPIVFINSFELMKQPSLVARKQQI